MSRTLYDEEHHGTRVTLWHERNETGEFVIAGQDIGEAPKRVFGDSDYEYWYTFNSNGEHLLASRLRSHLTEANAVTADEDLDAGDLLARAFRTGLFDTPAALTSFLTDESIDYEFASYA